MPDATVPRSRYRRRQLFVTAVLWLIVFILLAFPVWLFWPFDRIRNPEPLTTKEVERDLPPYRHHAAARDEIVFLRGSTLEVYRIDPALTQLRNVPITVPTPLTPNRVSAFPKTPRAIVFGDSKTLYIVSTETGQTEREITIPERADDVSISPDERWLALKLEKPSPPQGGQQNEHWRPVWIVDLQSDLQFELVSPDGPRASPLAMAFVSTDSLFVSCYPPGENQMWDLAARRLKWSVSDHDYNDMAHEAAASGSALVTGHHDWCKFWDVETGQILHSHGAARSATAVAINPKSGDYLAGYSRRMYTLRSGLGGTIRVWDANGERLATFAAHQETRWSVVNWMAVSSDGKYLVTSDSHTITVWDYATVSGRVK